MMLRLTAWRSRECLSESGATVLQATPATWRFLIEAGWRASPGFRAFCGGESMPRDLADSVARKRARAVEPLRSHGDHHLVHGRAGRARGRCDQHRPTDCKHLSLRPRRVRRTDGDRSSGRDLDWRRWRSGWLSQPSGTDRRAFRFRPICRQARRANVSNRRPRALGRETGVCIIWVASIAK